MRPDQGKKTKKDPKQSNQWKRLLVEARLSRQLHYMKLHRQQSKSGQLDDHIKVLAKCDQNRTNPLPGRPTNQFNQAERPDNSQTDLRPNAQSTSSFLGSINSRLNNATIDEVINEIQHQIIAHVNSQPFYVEQELRRRRAQQSKENETICRICFLPTSELYQPCRCDGTMKYIHRQCLSDWIKTNRSRTCNICYARYSGLTIIYHYPSASAWLTSDLFAVKQMIFFIFLIAISFALYSRRALEFYAAKIGSYRERANLVRLANYFARANALSEQYQPNGLYRGGGPRSSTPLCQANSRTHSLAINNMTAEFAVNGLSNLTDEAVGRVCEALNDTVAAVSGIGNELARRMVSNQAHGNLENRRITPASFESSRSTEPGSGPFDVHDQHYLANDDQLEEQQFTYSTNVFFWYLLVYLVNDLIQIVLYVVVCLLFVRYFIRQWLIWRHRNRSAEVVFDRPNHAADAQPD